MHLDKKDSDCKTTQYLKVYFTKEYKNFFMYRYIKKGNDLILLTPNNIENYYNTYIHVRSPMYCKNKNGFCNKCAGEYFYKLGISNIGLLTNKISGILLNTSLKNFHDQTIHNTTIDWKSYFK